MEIPLSSACFFVYPIKIRRSFQSFDRKIIERVIALFDFEYFITKFLRTTPTF